jgi:hypothetical protein
MKFDNATNLNRKSGVAKWRDLRFGGPFVEMVILYRAIDADYPALQSPATWCKPDTPTQT